MRIFEAIIQFQDKRLREMLGLHSSSCFCNRTTASGEIPRLWDAIDSLRRAQEEFRREMNALVYGHPAPPVCPLCGDLKPGEKIVVNGQSQDYRLCPKCGRPLT